VLGIMAFNASPSFCFLVPFIDRDPEKPAASLIFNICGVVALLFIVVMTIVGYVT
jgi:quinol-cytochrome oxidoreductase complex cytochrome b subunit